MNSLRYIPESPYLQYKPIATGLDDHKYIYTIKDLLNYYHSTLLDEFGAKTPLKVILPKQTKELLDQQSGVPLISELVPTWQVILPNGFQYTEVPFAFQPPVPLECMDVTKIEKEGLAPFEDYLYKYFPLDFIDFMQPIKLKVGADAPIVALRFLRIFYTDTIDLYVHKYNLYKYKLRIIQQIFINFFYDSYEFFSIADFLYFFSEILLLIFICLLTIFGIFNNIKKIAYININFISKISILFLIIIGLFIGDFLITSFSQIQLTSLGSTLDLIILNNNVVSTLFIFFIKLIVIICLISLLIISIRYLYTMQIVFFEYIILILCACWGMFLLLHANDFTLAYLAIEIQTLSFYILASLKKNSTISAESSLKYFIFGAIASGLFLLGTLFIYLATNTTNFSELTQILFYQNNFNFLIDSKTSAKRLLLQTNITEIIQEFSETTPLVLSELGFFFIFLGLTVKLGAAPFFSWAPDVYEGAPAIITALFSTIAKFIIIVFFVTLLRLFQNLFNLEYYDSFLNLFIFIGFYSLIIGILGAFSQVKIKKFLAFSSIAHLGYIYLSLSSLDIISYSASITYFIFYLFLNLGLWSLILIDNYKYMNLINYNKYKTQTYLTSVIKFLIDFKDLFRTNYFLSLGFIILFLIMAGIPPFIGFITKIYLFIPLIYNNSIFLVFIAFMLSAVSAFYYLRILQLSLFENTKNLGKISFNLTTQNAWIFVLFLFILLIFSISPNNFLFLIYYLINPHNIIKEYTMLTNFLMTAEQGLYIQPKIQALRQYLISERHVDGLSTLVPRKHHKSHKLILKAPFDLLTEKRSRQYVIWGILEQTALMEDPPTFFKMFREIMGRDPMTDHVDIPAFNLAKENLKKYQNGIYKIFSLAPGISDEWRALVLNSCNKDPNKLLILPIIADTGSLGNFEKYRTSIVETQYMFGRQTKMLLLVESKSPLLHGLSVHQIFPPRIVKYILNNDFTQEEKMTKFIVYGQLLDYYINAHLINSRNAVIDTSFEGIDLSEIFPYLHDSPHSLKNSN